ncbi:hypothetical protein BDQ94DRAFT_145283 [Aspergillus welwitschiae]|uniref:Uncharacterized protein n=1 Tax=Aspergillus welwitschiae TaxID=1341132 RepID=A0A3F3PZV1_9EURO|nr:hypothetical protein BDQ94DRAFT_145283 [Aspergillus welwitschiae]RDH32448.1 hypothetical protein BDQ94DRAFT_145283 [Aspergillus welwitschiae]
MLSAPLPRTPLPADDDFSHLFTTEPKWTRGIRETEFAVIFFDGLNQGSRLRRILSAKLEMLYTNGNANVYIRILGPLRRIVVADF